MSADTARALAGGDVQSARAAERLGAHTGATQRSYGDESQPTYWAHAPHLDEPDNGVRIHLAELAYGPQTVKDGRLDVDEALAVLVSEGW
jgi:hypothetical protein